MFTQQSTTTTPTPFSFFGQTLPQQPQQQQLAITPFQQTFPFGQVPQQTQPTMMETATPTTSQSQIVPFNWSGLQVTPQNQQQQQQPSFIQQPFFNPTQPFLQQQQVQPPPQNFSFAEQQQVQTFQIPQQPQSQQQFPIFNAFGQPSPSQTPIFGPFGQPQLQPFVMSQPSSQQQFQFGYPQVQGQQQPPYVLQPIFVQQPQLQPQQPSVMSFPMGDNANANTLPPNWGSIDPSLPEKYMRTSLQAPLEGRGPSILTPDPVFNSPLFYWGRNPSTSEPCAVGFNPELLPILMKSPGEEVVNRARRVKSMERLELDTLRAQVKLLSSNRGHYSSPSVLRDYTYPPPMGLFDQDPIRCHLRDEWTHWQERRRRRDLGHDERGDSEYQKHRRERGPPKYNDGIDPIIGKTLLERFDRPFDRKWNMRPLGERCRDGTTIDTVFDLPSSSATSTSYFTQGQQRSLFHNHRFIGNPSAPTHLPSPMKYCPNGLLRLGPKVTQDLAPRYRAPVRIGSNGLPVKNPGDECGVKLTKPNYFCYPDIATLDIIKNSCTGQTIVNEFTVGHSTHGEVVFPGAMDVSGLDLDQIVEFSHKEIIIYPNSNVKPPYGQELNRRAIVTLKNVWPKCKETGQDIRDVGKITELNYERVLLKSCSRFNGKFLSYNPTTGIWMFEIQQIRPIN